MEKNQDIKKIFVARQPIFNKTMQIFGYELLFRSNKENIFLYEDNISNNDLDYKDTATIKLLNNTYTIFGIKKLVQSKKAFINFTENLINNNFVPEFPNKNIVFEIPSNINTDKKMIEKLIQLKSNYEIAINNISFDKSFTPIIRIADYIKIDISQYKPDILKKIIHLLKKYNKIIIAEKIEFKKQFDFLKSMNVDYYQGYFFQKPEMISSEDLPPHKLNYLKIIEEVNKQNIELSNLVDIIQKDVGLSYKLLQYINSAFFGFNRKIKSIRDALNLLGISQIKKWVTIIGLSLVSEDKPDELLKNALIRAKFAELLSKSLSMENKRNELFLMGMFSLLDVFFNRPINVLITELPIDDEIKKALNGNENIYHIILQLIKDYEHGKWDNIIKLTKKLKLTKEPIPQFYFEAIEWAQEAIE